jgi:hypothetical protein
LTSKNQTFLFTNQKIKTMKKINFSFPPNCEILEEPCIYKNFRGLWRAATIIKYKGQAIYISTQKRSNGKISTNARFGTYKHKIWSWCYGSKLIILKQSTARATSKKVTELFINGSNHFFKNFDGLK